MTAIYIVSAWLVMQVADVVFPGWGIPEDAIRFVVYAVVAGFPLALVFAWTYDITSHGIRRTPQAGVDLATPLSVRDLGLLGVLLVLFVAISWSFASRVVATRSMASGPPGSNEPVSSNSLAILPFRNESLEPGEASFLANGVHRDLMTKVMKIATLDIIAPNSVEQYRDTDKRSSVIGEELAVGHILEGAVQKAGQRVRISVQLVQASSERSLWAESYDRTLTADNLFDIQADIAQQVAQALQAELTPVEISRINSVPTRVFEAYEAFARGNNIFNQTDAEAIEDAISYYQQAIDLEPDFALAHAMLGQVQLQAHQFGGLSREDTYTEAELNLRKAIELDETTAMAHAWLGVIARDRDRDYAKAIGLLDTALAYEPGNSRIMHIKGLTLRLMGRQEEALFWYERAMRLDPLSLVVNESFGSLLRDMGRYEKAEQQYLDTFEMDPEFPNTWWGLGSLYWSMGQPDRGIDWFNGAIARVPVSDAFRAWLSLLYLELDMDEQAAAEIRIALRSLKDFENYDVQFLQRLLLIYRDEDPSVVSDQWGEESHTWFGNVMKIPLPELLMGQYQDAVAAYQARFPALRNVDMPVDGTDFRAAVDLALALEETGETRQADALLNRAEAFLLTQNRLGFRGYWVEDARIAAIRGDKSAALAALTQAVDEGWRNLWWFYLRHDPVLASIRSEPGFQSLHDQVQAEMQDRATASNAEKPYKR